VTAVNGVATFTNLSYNIAETITIDFAGGGFAGRHLDNYCCESGGSQPPDHPGAAFVSRDGGSAFSRSNR